MILFLVLEAAPQLISIQDKLCQIDFGLSAYLKIAPGQEVLCKAKRGCKGPFLSVELRYEGKTKNYLSLDMHIGKAQHKMESLVHQFQLWIECREDGVGPLLFLVFPLDESNRSSTLNIFDFLLVDNKNDKKVYAGKHLLSVFANYIEMYLYESRLGNGTAYIVAVSKKHLNYRKEQSPAIAKIVKRSELKFDDKKPLPAVVLRTLAENQVQQNALQQVKAKSSQKDRQKEDRKGKRVKRKEKVKGKVKDKEKGRREQDL